MADVREINVGELKLADDNLRTEVGDVEELAASIKVHGVLEPLLVRDDGLLVVCGGRRLAAAKKAGLKTVPAIVRPFTEQERVETMVVENLQREDLTPIEEANGFQRLVELGLSNRQIAQRVGCSHPHVARRLSMLGLPEAVQESVAAGKLGVKDAEELTKLKAEPKIAERIAKERETGAADYASQRLQQAVDRELEKKKKQAAYDKLVAAMTKKKEPIIEARFDHYTPQPRDLPEGYRVVHDDGHYLANAVRMDPGKHAKQKCHAIAINPHTAAVVEICTDPKKHPEKPTEVDKLREKRRVELEGRLHRWNENGERRLAWFKELLKRPPDPKWVLELACHELLSGHRAYSGRHEDSELAFLMLGYEVPDYELDPLEPEASFRTVERQYGEAGDRWVDLRKKVEESAAERLRITAALLIVALDEQLDEVWYADDAYEAHGYLDLLMKVGYEPSELEQETRKAVEEEIAAEAEEALGNETPDGENAEVDLVEAIRKSAAASASKSEDDEEVVAAE